MATWEMAVCDGVLSRMLPELTVRPSPEWDIEWNEAHLRPRKAPCVIADIENARNASPQWRAIIDESPEWALIRLSRWDFELEMDVVWEAYDEYVMNCFDVAWDIFNTSWTLHHPIACPRLRRDSIGWLTVIELAVLRSHLLDPANIRIVVEEGGSRRHAPGIWVAPRHRS